LRVDSIGHQEKKAHVTMCLIRNYYRGKYASIESMNKKGCE